MAKKKTDAAPVAATSKSVLSVIEKHADKIAQSGLTLTREQLAVIVGIVKDC